MIPCTHTLKRMDFGVRCRGFIMQEYELDILEQYDVEIKDARKTRGAFLCDTEQGLFLLKEAAISDKRAEVLDGLGKVLAESGYERTDRICPNKEGQLISVSEDGSRYMLKHWYYGRECDVRRSRELFEGVANLARLHLIMKMPVNECETEAPLVKMYESRNRELRKVRQFIRSRTTRGEFELQFLKEFEGLFEWAGAGLSELKQSEYEKLYRDSQKEQAWIHGEYNYHNILFAQEGIATTCFEKAKCNVQAEDLYYFLRKAMEKHRWNVRLCDCMLNAYNAVRPLSELEMEYLKIRFIYPEKFWKIAGSYYRSNKAWISVKNVEKFQVAVSQTEEKKQLLKDIFGFSL